MQSRSECVSTSGTKACQGISWHRRAPPTSSEGAQSVRPWGLGISRAPSKLQAKASATYLKGAGPLLFVPPFIRQTCSDWSIPVVRACDWLSHNNSLKWVSLTLSPVICHLVIRPGTVLQGRGVSTLRDSLASLEDVTSLCGPRRIWWPPREGKSSDGFARLGESGKGG